jgi:hypothetical protein
MRAIGYALLFLVGVLLALVAAIPIFLRSLIKGARAFHPRGTVCHAEVTALDGDIGARLAGPARVRFASSTAAENSPDPSIIGMGIKLGTDQDLAAGTFESFIKLSDGVKNTNVADYLANQYASVAPWRIRGLGVMWFRVIPDPAANVPKSGLRTERLDADIAAGRAKFILEAREGPGPDGAVHSRLVELRLTERLHEDDPKFHISMFRRGRGFIPTGFRNGVRAILYPVSQAGRSLRGG